LEEGTRRSWDADNQQAEAARSAYARSQMQMRQWNKELNEFAEMQKFYQERGEEPPYKTIGAFRRAYRSAEGSLAYAKTHYYRRDVKQYEEFAKALGQHRMPKTLAEFQQMKYNDRKEFELFNGFKKANQKKHISALVSFDVYKQVSKEIDEKLVGQTIGGITIKGKVTHFIDRVIGEYQESDYKQRGKRQGVLIDALKAIIDNNPTASKTEINDIGERSVSFDYGGYRLTIDPDNCLLIQTNKIKKK